MGIKDHLIGVHPVPPALSINSAKRFKCVIKYKLCSAPRCSVEQFRSAEVFAEPGFAVSLLFLGHKN